MHILSDEYKTKSIIENLVEAGKQKKSSRDPLVTERVGKAIDLIEIVKKKGAVHNEKKYNHLRQAFEQNYKKINS